VFYFGFAEMICDVNGVIVPASSILAVSIFESSIFKDLVWIHHKAMISAISVKIMRAHNLLPALCFMLFVGWGTDDLTGSVLGRFFE